MNAGIRAHVLQVTDVLIRKVHMSARHQSQVILFGKFLPKIYRLSSSIKKMKFISRSHFKLIRQFEGIARLIFSKDLSCKAINEMLNHCSLQRIVALEMRRDMKSMV